MDQICAHTSNQKILKMRRIQKKKKPLTHQTWGFLYRTLNKYKIIVMIQVRKGNYYLRYPKSVQHFRIKKLNEYIFI